MLVAQKVNATVTYFAYLKNLNKTIGYAINAKLTITKRTVDSFNVALDGFNIVVDSFNIALDSFR